MKSLVKALLIAAATTGLASGANAAITVTATPGTDPYSGPTPTYDFESPAPITGGIVDNTSIGGIRAQPFGSTGNYWAVGPIDNGAQPGILDLSSFGDITSISFIWGSVDSYNMLEFLDALGNTITGGTFVGNDIFNPANGDQTNPNTNPLVTFTISGADSSAVSSLRLTSTQNAFETDNFAISSAPEPGTWAMMLLGFGAVGVSMRQRRKPGGKLAQLA
jgi:PEP-CTERM motif